jgi:RNA polymerase sigma factor (sigma-70 family)
MTALALDPPRLPALAAPDLCSDEALARRAGTGDDAAYAAIYARYHARIEAYCRAMVRHDEDARDAAQTAMTKALVAMRTERGAAHLRPWLFRIAHNEALTVLRRRRGRRVREHLRACSACREWDAAQRRNGGALSALPAALTSAASWLWSWIGGAAASAPGTVGATAAAKVVTGVAVIAAGTAPIAQREIVHRAAQPPAKPHASAATPRTARRAAVAASRSPAPVRGATRPGTEGERAQPLAATAARPVTARSARPLAAGSAGPLTAAGHRPPNANVRGVPPGALRDGRSRPAAPAAPVP